MPPLSTLAQTVQTTLTSALVAAGSILLSGVAKHLVAVANRKGPREPPEEPREDGSISRKQMALRAPCVHSIRSFWFLDYRSELLYIHVLIAKEPRKENGGELGARPEDGSSGPCWWGGW